MAPTREERDEETRQRALADLDKLHHETYANTGLGDLFQRVLRASGGAQAGPGGRVVRLVFLGVTLGLVAHLVTEILAVYL